MSYLNTLQNTINPGSPQGSIMGVPPLVSLLVHWATESAVYPGLAHRAWRRPGLKFHQHWVLGYKHLAGGSKYHLYWGSSIWFMPYWIMMQAGQQQACLTYPHLKVLYCFLSGIVLWGRDSFCTFGPAWIMVSKRTWRLRQTLRNTSFILFYFIVIVAFKLLFYYTVTISRQFEGRWGRMSSPLLAKWPKCIPLVNLPFLLSHP